MTHNIDKDQAAADWDLFGSFLVLAGDESSEQDPGWRWHRARCLFRRHTGRDPLFDVDAAWRDCRPSRVPLDAFVPERVDCHLPPSQEVG